MVERTGAFVVTRVPARKRSAPPPSLSPRAAADPPLWSATIRGEPTPHARQHDVVLTDGVARLVKSGPVRAWQNLAVPQLLHRRPARPLALDLVLDCRFWSSKRRLPSDEALVIDVLERAAIIAHRRQIREKHVFAAIDSDDPRVSISLTRAGGEA
jgi:hypothetical protein